MEKESLAINKAKKWQIALFPFNNAATNVYFAFYTYFSYYATLYLTGSMKTAIGGAVVTAASVLVISTFSSIFIPAMRIFDGITDPIIGGIIDKTRSKYGKFRPFMIIGNALLALSLLIMMVFFKGVKNDGFRWFIYIFSYFVYVIGYTCQTACTKAGQTCLTNDPKQRSEFVIWNMVGQIGSIVLINVLAGGVLTNEAICPKGEIIYVVDGVEKVLRGAAYGEAFYNIMVPTVILLSAFYTALAVAAIWSKDNPKFWGVANENKTKFKDYVNIVKENKQLKWLVISSGFNKLASTVATSGTVAFMLYGCLMDDYNGLFIPFYALCFIFMGGFFVWGSKTAGKKGQKRGVTQFTILAFLFYLGVLILLCIYDRDNPATHITLFSNAGGNFKITVNLYTVLFIVLYGCGYGAFNCCDQLTIPMVADCTDYETCRSGNYVPGIMGTIFSLVDKIISSLQQLLLQLFIVFLVPGLNALPAEGTPYMEGMKLSTIICFCLLPMCSWLITIYCMKHYSLSGDKLIEIQAINSVRKDAVEHGMPQSEALSTWTRLEQVPHRYVNIKAKDTSKLNILDKIYNKFFIKREEVITLVDSDKVVEIPEKYLSNKTND